jgi:3-isopropylmalate/(R)-2-methylmalate dehydratase small subunit
MPRIVFALGDDVSTDVIYPGRYMATVLPTETPEFAFADHAEFNAALRSGDVPAGSVVAAGWNFGCGSSREQAVSTLVGHGLAVVARSFARIFLQNAVNLGLRVYTVPDVEVAIGDEVAISAAGLVDVATGRTFPVTPLPKARQEILDTGGLIAYTRRRILAASGATHDVM